MLKYLTQQNADDIGFIKNILFNLKLSHLVEEPVRLIGGSKSFAYQVNDYVVRFPKAEIIWQSQQQEAQISKLLQANLPDKWKNKVTNVICCSTSEYPFAYHKMIKGKICDNIRGETDYSTCYDNLSEKQKKLLAQDIAEFLVVLHSIPTDITNPMAENWNFTNKADFDYELCKSVLLKYSNNKVNLDDFKSEIANDDIVFAHNDMSGSNILLDEKQEHVLQGVLDFGNAGNMPRINEFFPYYKINRHLARQIIGAYNNVSDIKIKQSQVDYTVLVYLGDMIYNQEKQGKAAPKFALTILNGFIKDLYGDNLNASINTTSRKYYSRSQGSRYRYR